MQYRGMIDRKIPKLYNNLPMLETVITVQPVCNDHLYNKIYYLRFIQ